MMFEEDMSSRLLNVEKLERRFASLTRSRESIQGLSMWIIRHKEFHKEIVNQWLDALKRDFNALTMFYVANDVIQNCARKKSPEYRDAFATVLEQAVSLEKVKEIKSEVIRMISLWQDREIYEDTFFKKLEEKLNSDVTKSANKVGMELSEEEIIANFKLENLIKSLKRLQTLEDELSEKQSFLDDIEEPEISNLDNLIVKMESQKEIRKIDRYQKLVQDVMNLTEKVNAAKKSLILDLKYSSIFYNAQNEDAKKVAHAYRIYGKKIKHVEKLLLEKVLSFPVPSPVSSPVENILNPVMECDTPDKLSADISTSPSKYKINNEESIPPVIIKSEKEENAFNVNVETEQEETIVHISDKTLKEDSVVNICFKDECNENISNLCTRKGKDQKENISSCHLADIEVLNNKKPKSEITTNIVIEKNDDSSNAKLCFSPFSSKTKNPDIEIKSNICETKVENLDYLEKNLPKTTISAESIATSIDSDSSEMKSISDTDIHDDIDFLLEKAYNVQTKSKTNFKRKIDNLLKLKQSKACKLASSENSQNLPENNENLSEASSSDKLFGNNKYLKDSLPASSESKLTTIASENEDTSHNIVYEDSLSVEVVNVDKHLKTSERNKPIQLDKNDVEIDQPTQTKLDVEPSITSDDKSSTCSNTLGFQAFSDIPKELLKNILDKNKVNMSHPSTICNNLSYVENVTTPEISHESALKCNKTNGNNQTAESHTTSLETFTSAESQKVKHGTLNENSSAGNRSIGFITKCNDSIPESTNVLVNNTVDSLPTFSKSLYNVLKCFSRKELSTQELNSPQSLTNSPSMPLENTLKVYNCLMQCYSKDYSLTEATLNTCSTLPNVKVAKTEFETKSDLNLQGPKLSAKEEITMQADNLEIMDMDVDSEDNSN